jgi:hypothetical protein
MLPSFTYLPVILCFCASYTMYPFGLSNQSRVEVVCTGTRSILVQCVNVT